MTLGDLRKRLAFYLGLEVSSSDGLVGLYDKEVLNSSARLISTLLRIPRKTVEIRLDQLPNSTYTISDPQPEVIQMVDAWGGVVPLVEDADLVPPDDTKPFSTWRPAPIFAIQRGSDLRFYVSPNFYFFDNEFKRVKVQYYYLPPTMSAETDAPWDGQYPRFHEMIAAHAAMQALLALDPGEQETLLRYNAAKEVYEKLEREFKEALDRSLPTQPGSRAAMYDVRVRRSRWW